MNPVIASAVPHFSKLGDNLWARFFNTKDSRRDIPLEAMSAYAPNPPFELDYTRNLAADYGLCSRTLLGLRNYEHAEFWTMMMNCIVRESERFPELDGLIRQYYPDFNYLPSKVVGIMPALFQVMGYMMQLPGVVTKKVTDDQVCLIVRHRETTMTLGVQGGALWRHLGSGAAASHYRRVPTAFWQGESPRLWSIYPSLPNRVLLGPRAASMARYLRARYPAYERVWLPALTVGQLAGCLNVMLRPARWCTVENPMTLDREELARSLAATVDSPVLTRRQILYSAVVPHWLDHERFVDTFGDPLDLFETVVTEAYITENVDVILRNVK